MGGPAWTSAVADRAEGEWIAAGATTWVLGGDTTCELGKLREGDSLSPQWGGLGGLGTWQD